jgi:polysaccharide deacetylase family protein (PEP-CTERM system associated)
LVYTQTPDQFRDDIARAKASLEDIIGAPVIGYRAPGFSITDGTPWALDVVAQAGYLYDASVFPASRGHGGISQYRMEPHEVVTESGSLMEFPASVASLPIGRLCFFGGGYLRLFPYSVIQRMARGVNREGRPVIYYVHPREIDPDHPRLEMGSVRRFKSYVNLNSTLGKISRLLAEQELVSFRDWLALKAEVASAAASSGDGRARATTPSSPRQALTA